MARHKKATDAPQLTATAKQELSTDHIPPMTVPLAVVFAKMLHVGCPAVSAALYCCPTLTNTEDAKVIARVWLGDKLVIAAINAQNGGQPWAELDLDQRLQLARMKAIAEAAYYLWTTNFSELEGRDALEKHKIARDLVNSHLGLKNEDDPMAAFARFAQDLVKANLELSRVNTGIRRVAKSDVPADANSPLERLLNTPPVTKA